MCVYKFVYYHCLILMSLLTIFISFFLFGFNISMFEEIQQHSLEKSENQNEGIKEYFTVS